MASTARCRSSTSTEAGRPAPARRTARRLGSGCGVPTRAGPGYMARWPMRFRPPGSAPSSASSAPSPAAPGATGSTDRRRCRPSPSRSGSACRTSSPACSPGAASRSTARRRCLDPLDPALDARPRDPHRHGVRRRPPRQRRDRAAPRSRSSATTMSTARPRRRCSPAGCGRSASTPRIHIPDRIFEGYGPNPEAIRALRAAGRRPAGHRRLRHHQPGGAGGGARGRLRDARGRPSPGRRSAAAAAAIVNPNRQDDLSGQGHLAACGVVFLLLVATSRVLRRSGWFGAEPAGARPAGGARPRRARHRRRRGAAQGPQPRLRGARPCGDAPARPAGPHRPDGRGAARRPAAPLSPRLPDRPAHQCRRAHRRCRPRRAPAD